MRILLVEDDEKLKNSLAFQLQQEGFIVDTCSDGEEALYYIEQNIHDLILLDRMLPYLSGTDVLSKMRGGNNQTPVILITALGTLDDKVQGLDLGADDYLVKPYAIEELLARIRALSRRPKAFSDHRRLSFLDICFDPDTRILTCRDEEQLLSKRKALLLEFFLRNPNKTLTREQIYSRVWGPDGTVEDGNLDTYVYFLRKHLQILRSHACISTVHGVGYRLEGAENHVS